MQYITDRTVELTECEALIAEIHALLMDQGMHQHDAVDKILGSTVPIYLKSATPILDKVISAEFIAWLRE